MNESTFTTAVAKGEFRPGPGRKVLLVDNDERTREALSQALQGWAFAAFTAATIREARRAVLNAGPFTAIVCEYQLPDGNGLDFHDWLEWEMLIDVPFLLISRGVAREPAAFDSYEFLAKPLPLEKLRRRLENLSLAEREPAASSC